MPREPLHKIWMRSNQRFIRYRAHKLFGWQFFQHILRQPSFFMNYTQKLIRSSDVPREPTPQIWMLSNQRLIRYRAHKLFGLPFFQNVFRQPSRFVWFFPKKLIRSSEIPRKPPHQIWMRSNQRFIRYRAHKLFEVAIFLKCPPSAILFFINSSQKLIRSSEIPRETAYKIRMGSIQWLIRYRSHKLFWRPSWKMAANGVVQKNIWDELARHISHVCKK